MYTVYEKHDFHLVIQDGRHFFFKMAAYLLRSLSNIAIYVNLVMQSQNLAQIMVNDISDEKHRIFYLISQN